MCSSFLACKVMAPPAASTGRYWFYKLLTMQTPSQHPTTQRSASATLMSFLGSCDLSPPSPPPTPAQPANPSADLADYTRG